MMSFSGGGSIFKIWRWGGGHKLKWPETTTSASSVRIPNSINNFRTLIPALRLRPLNLLSASPVKLHGLANTSIYHKNRRVMLSPLKSPVLRKYSKLFKRPGI